MRDSRIIVNSEALREAIRLSPYKTSLGLSKSLGLHRNTIQNYLHGAPAVPEGLERILLALNLSPEEALQLREEVRTIPGNEISDLVSKLVAKRPQAALVLFGSQARGTAKKFSDFDLGIFSAKPLQFSEFSKLLSEVADYNQESKYEVQLTNLCLAEFSFLATIAKDFVFLGGDMSSYLALLSKAGVRIE